MASKTTIANLALGHFGQFRITDISLNTPSAIVCREYWDHARDYALRVLKPNFAKEVKILTKVLPAPDFGWSARFALPGDFIGLLEFNGRLTGIPDCGYEQIAFELHTNEEKAEIKYIRRVIETEKWDPTFVEAFSFKLAELIAPSLTLSADAFARFAQAKQESAVATLMASAAETPPRVKTALEGSQYLQARRWA